ncbi:MAG: methyltransferase domain-containing protein [Pseudomonadota bacterium]
MSDHETLRIYDRDVETYRGMVTGEPAASLVAFADALPQGARVLDLGSGPGHAAQYLAQRGFAAEAWDASVEMAKAAAAAGVTARQASFDDLKEKAVYAGIYASFSLLHAPKSEMPRHLASIARALIPSGLFHIGMKTGTGEKRDSLGRFYAYYERDELAGLLDTAGFDLLWEDVGETLGMDGKLAPFVLMRARKRG